jgi:hypothetical protein
MDDASGSSGLEGHWHFGQVQDYAMWRKEHLMQVRAASFQLAQTAGGRSGADRICDA